MKFLFLSSGSNNTQSWVLLQRKIRDQGSNFSQETAKLATGVLTTEEIGISFYLCDFQSVTLRRCVTNKPPAMRVRIEGYTKKTPIAIQ